MKKSVVVGFLVLSMLLFASCGGATDDQSTSDGQTSADDAEVSRTEKADENEFVTFDDALDDYFKVDVDTVYRFVGDDSRVDVLAALDEHIGGEEAYYFEGEYCDDSGALLDYFNEVYTISPKRLCQSFNDNPLEGNKSYQTIWLKSPVTTGDTWQTTYYDAREGFVDARVTALQIDDDIVVKLEVVDQSVAEADRRTVLRKFSEGATPLGDTVLFGDDTLPFSESFDYKAGGDAANLKRYYSDDDNIKELFADNPIEIMRLLGDYKKAVRATDDVEDIAIMTKRDLELLFEKNTVTVPRAMLDLASYGYAHSNEDVAVLDAFIEAVNYNIYGLQYSHIIANYALYLNNALNEVLRLTDFDGTEMFKRPLPIPQAGDFLGAKYFEKAYRERALYYSVLPYDMAMLEVVDTDLIEPQVVVYSQAKYAFSTSLQTDSTNAAIYAELATLIETLSAEYDKRYYERQDVDGVLFKDRRYYRPYIVELLESADSLYEQLDEKYKNGAKRYMKQIVQLAFLRRELPGKYYSGVGLYCGDGLAHIMRGSYDGESTPEMFDRELAEVLRDFKEEHPDSYFNFYITVALDNFEKYNYCYHQPLEDMLLELTPYKGVWEAPYSAHTMSDDIKNYYIDLAVDDDLEAMPAAVTVEDLQSLVDAIAPGARVALKPNTYLLSPRDGNYFGEYAKIENGVLTIEGVSDLTICATRGFAQIISYELNDVVELKNCKNVTLSGLRLGHMVKEYCNGSAIHIAGSHGINLQKSIFYGCGFNGISVWDSDGVAVSDSVISGCDSDGIAIRDSAQLMIAHCYLRDNGDYAIKAINSKDITISNCTTDNNFNNPEYVDTEAAIIYGIDSTLRLSENTYIERIAPCVYDGGSVTID